MGLRRAVVCRAVLGTALLVGGACGAARPIQTVATPRATTTTWTTQAPVAAEPTIDPAPTALPGDSGSGGGGGGTRVVRGRSGGPTITGRIEIPKIGLDHLTYEGNTLAQINHGPSHWPGTPMPGHAGNTVFPGHRTTHSKPFFHINELVPGDAIVFTTGEGRFVYSVYESHIVRPTDMWVVDNTPDAVVTIFGCHPRGSAKFRYVVRGRLISTPLAAKPSPAQAQPQPPTASPPATQAPPPPPPPTTAPPRRTGCIICL
jgi:LPXTG-site transpeptidase (sortase) family protein